MSLLLAAMMAFCQADDYPFGPLDQRSHGLFQVGTTGFVPDSPTGLKQDQLQIHMTLSSINVLNTSEKPAYDVDMEFERISLNMWYGVTDRLSAGVQIPFETANGGFQDNFIAGFHKTFGIGLGSRTKFPRDHIGADVGGVDAGIRPTMGLGDVIFQANYQIFQSGEFPGWSVGYQFKIPTADQDYIHKHELGVGLATNFFYQTGDWYWNVGFSFATPGDEGILGQKARSFVETLFVMIEYRIFDWLSVVGQGTLQSGPVVDFGEYSKWSLCIDGGFKIRIDKSVTWDIGFFENAVKYENSADFGLFTGLTLKY